MHPDPRLVQLEDYDLMVGSQPIQRVREKARAVQLVQEEDFRTLMGQKARKTVQDNFLMIRLLEQYLDLLNSFKVTYHYTGQSQ